MFLLGLLLLGILLSWLEARTTLLSWTRCLASPWIILQILLNFMITVFRF
ncbi:hypothetical protein Ahy_A10g050426 isoform B [Arachis hypogaea]|uniref:Uncharacterized protein n=1 Tax=Arachis hypogaea TaxID=3818 RepID=A0A445B9C5_ARAHY|nr:hypothetical protein Ahy_A10g050426 isoform B [Arachis hypogaea]